MKKIIIMLFCGFMFFSCGTTVRTLTPAEIKIMTTKQMEADYDMVFTSTISLLQSEGFLVSSTDKETGLINAFKQVDNKNAELHKFLWGSAIEASTSQVSVFIQGLNKELTEVKLTIYEGSINSSMGVYGVENKSTKNSMVQDATIYAAWFNNLRAEIERRKALLQ